MKVIAALVGLLLGVSASSVAYASEAGTANSLETTSQPLPFLCVIDVTGPSGTTDIPYIRATVQIAPTDIEASDEPAAPANEPVAPANEPAAPANEPIPALQPSIEVADTDEAQDREVLPVEKGLQPSLEVLPVHSGLMAIQSLSGDSEWTVAEGDIVVIRESLALSPLS